MMLYWHRLIAVCGIVLLLFVVVTGVGIQLADMRALVGHAPATDPDMLMMRQHITGTPGFAVVAPADYSAPALPAVFDYAGALAKTAALGRAAAPGEPMTLAEVRTVAGRPIGHVQMGDRQLGFDLATGAPVAEDSIPEAVTRDVPGSTRHFFKKLHQFRWVGPLGSFLSGLAGVLFAGMMVTGLWQFVRVYRQRASKGRKALFWKGGGVWRELHRATAVTASVVLVWIVGTGILMSIDDIGGSLARLSRGGQPAARPAPPPGRGGGAPRGGMGGPDVASPLGDAELPGMAATTLAAFRQAEPGIGIRVLRLRHYAGYRQGVVIAADGDTSQLVYNAATGAPMSMQEKGYPDTGFPYGWEWHQRMKRLHRGDFFGMTGRWLATLGGLSLLYLSVSGVVMYARMWLRRRANGRGAVVW